MSIRFPRIKLPIWVVVVIVSAPLFMGGLAAVAVTLGQNRSETVCDAVRGLRIDLVESLRALEARAIKANRDTRENIEEGYNLIISKIGDPKCP